jgi:hypothetical protein
VFKFGTFLLFVGFELLQLFFIFFGRTFLQNSIGLLVEFVARFNACANGIRLAAGVEPKRNQSDKKSIPTNSIHSVNFTRKNKKGTRVIELSETEKLINSLNSGTHQTQELKNSPTQ